MKARVPALLSFTLGAVLTLQQPASASAERMNLRCDTGDLAGHVLERSNGSSWWDVTDGTVYTTTSIHISSAEDGTLYTKEYGGKSGDPLTCTALHEVPGRGALTWSITVVPAGAP